MKIDIYSKSTCFSIRRKEVKKNFGKAMKLLLPYLENVSYNDLVFNKYPCLVIKQYASYYIIRLRTEEGEWTQYTILNINLKNDYNNNT